jgi:C4-dicarboxylate transporter DctM subunit
MIALGGITASLTEFMLSVCSSKNVFLLYVNILFLIAGMFLETNTSIVLFAPIFMPIAKAYCIDPVHFGAIMLLNLEIGLITPPFAANLFVSCKITKTTLDEVIKPLLPFYVVCLVTLVITTFFPECSLFLVRLFG